MTSARSPRATTISPDAGLASWYAPGRSDGFGDRLLMFDNTDVPSMELLRFRPELTVNPAFEAALRERVRRLQRFRHPAFSTVRAVEHLEAGGGLTLVSTHVPGQRIAGLFSERPRGGLHPAVVAWLLRELTPALAALQSEGADIAHGAITADRIVLTPDGTLCLEEHTLGGALQEQRLPRAMLWQEFNILGAPGEDGGSSLLNAQADVVQLAAVALSTLLARPLTFQDVTSHLPGLLDEFSESVPERAAHYVAPLRAWLEQALQLTGSGYRSASEALEGLKQLPERSGNAMSLMSAKPTLVPPAHEQPLQPRPDALPDRVVAGAKPQDVNTIDFVAAFPTEIAGSFGPRPEAVAPRRAPARSARVIALVLACVAAGEAAVLAFLLSRDAVPPAASSVLIESPNPGAAVIVDGRRVGATPMRVTLGSTTPSIRVESALPVAPAAQVTPTAPARQRSGGIRLSVPFELQVFEGERVLGSTADGPIVARAGVHQLDLVNTALGFRLRQVVTIRAGEIQNLTITPPRGRISINAEPWAQVWVDQEAVGDTPLANIPVALGVRQVVFRHPQLGERRQTVTVRADGPARVSVSFVR